MNSYASMWVVAFAAAVLIGRVGQALLAAGASRSKNVASALGRSAADFCFAVLAFFVLGPLLLFPGSGYFAGMDVNDSYASTGSRVKDAVIALLNDLTNRTPSDVVNDRIFFFAVLAVVASGVATTTVMERSRFRVVGVVSVLTAGVIFPLAGRWAWSGWLAKMHFVDVGGACVVHVAAGVAGLVAAALIGPRLGKYNTDGSANMIPGHSLGLMGVGKLLLLTALVPWMLTLSAYRNEFHPMVAMNVLLGAAAGGLSAMSWTNRRYTKIDVLLALSGMLGGAISVTAAGPFLNGLPALIVGAIAGWLVCRATIWFDLKLHLDDPAGVIAIHLVGGAWGTLAAGFFANGTSGERLRAVLVQAGGLLAIAAMSAAVTATCFLLLRCVSTLRVREEEEFDGLDLAEHDVNAYPDFQQTTIKSYHAREM